MAREKIITAVDIGSSETRVGCALIKDGSAPRLVGVGESPSLGVRRGQVIDIEEVVSSLNEAFREAERSAGFKISKAVVALSGPQIDLKRSKGSVAISRANGEVSAEDMKRVLESSKAVSIPQNKQIIHTQPVSYTVDDDVNIENPIGMKGVRLEVDTLLILASQPVLRTISKALEESSRQTEKWVFGPLAVSRAVLSKKQKEAGVLLLNLGGTTTNLSVFKNRQLEKTSVLSLGGVNVTNDIAIGLKCAIDVAEKVKRSYGSCYALDVSKREQVVLADWGLEDINISRYALAQIIESRSREIIGEVQREVKGLIKDKSLPAGVVLTGGGAKMIGVNELIKQNLKLPIHVGRVKEVESELPEAFDPAWSTVIGSILMAYDQEVNPEGETSASEDANKIMDKAKEWLRDLLP